MVAFETSCNGVDLPSHIVASIWGVNVRLPSSVTVVGKEVVQPRLSFTVTDDWQLYLLPWDALAQWPCPNRLAGGIDPADIAKIEIKFVQGSTYDLWLDNVAFYRRRLDGGSSD